MSQVKDTIIMILVAAVLMVWYIACNQHMQIEQQHSAENNKTGSPPQLQQYKTYKDSAGHIHLVVKDQQPTKEEVQKLMPFVDSVSKALDIKAKQVESVTTIETETQAKAIAFMQKTIDSLKRVTYYYKDKYLQLAIRTGNPSDTADKGDFDFKYNAELTISQYSKRRKFLGIGIGAKQSYIDISSTDPRTTVMGVKKYTAIQKQPSFGLRIQAIQNYSFISNSANTGIRATFDLKHMSFTGGYYYNWDSRIWRPSLSMGYDLIRF